MKSIREAVKWQGCLWEQTNGAGKSLISQSAPMIFDIMKETTYKSITVVISPLTSH